MFKKVLVDFEAFRERFWVLRGIYGRLKGFEQRLKGVSESLGLV